MPKSYLYITCNSPMTSPRPIPPHISLFLFVICIAANTRPPATADDSFQSRLRNDTNALTNASIDYGNMIHELPNSVLYPSSVGDIIDLVKSSNSHLGRPFTIAARGNGHSVRGQAMSRGGVVVDMTALKKTDGSRINISGNIASGFHADVGAEQLWIDVLRATLERGLAPVSWTDYLYLSVGGTLSNAGVSGQAFKHGPQITNVLELDVITGKGEFFTCSPHKNRELFFAVLGGLGQFGIITRARIILKIAQTSARWLKLLYSDFRSFTSDLEYLISSDVPSYVEGFLITREDALNQYNSSFSSSDQVDIYALLKKQGILYYIELATYYDNQTANTIDGDIETLLEELTFLPGYTYSMNVPLFSFLGRVGYLKYPQGPSDAEAHPWLVLFIPQSIIYDFSDQVLSVVVTKFNQTSSQCFIIYPLYRQKWDNRMSAVIPSEEVFYTLSLLHSTQSHEYQVIDELNNEILARSKMAGLKVKQFFPHYTTKGKWIEHFGPKWASIRQRKEMFDPKMILSPGQRIFN